MDVASMIAEVSALLRRAGYDRSGIERTAIGDGVRAEGWEIFDATAGTLYVVWYPAHGTPDDPGRRSVRLSAYALAIEACGFKVGRFESRIIVTAPSPDGSQQS